MCKRYNLDFSRKLTGSSPPQPEMEWTCCLLHTPVSPTGVQPPRDGRSNEQQQQQQQGDAAGKGKGKGKGGLAGAKRDHINALGLPNDGYDYDQHLKSMGERVIAIASRDADFG